MKDTVRWINHKGKRILLVDFKDYTTKRIKTGEYKNYLQEARQIIDTQPRKSLLIITDITNAGFTYQSNTAMKSFAKANTPYVKASAVVGVTGLKKVVITSVRILTGRNIKIFDTVDEAKEWLVSV